MNDTQKVDLHKRQTLTTMTGLAGAGAFATFPTLAMALSATDGNSLVQTEASPATAVDIEAVLVSMPGSDQESLLLHNLTDQDITIDRFHSNQLIFDGDLVDCNDVCVGSRITIKARQNKLIQFKRQTVRNTTTPGWQYLDVNATVNRLPEGTRVVPFDVRMSGTEAMLATRVPALPA